MKMTSITPNHQRNNSDPIPGFIRCDSCTNYFKKTQKHFDDFYQRSKLCSYRCIIFNQLQIQKDKRINEIEIDSLFRQMIKKVDEEKND